jgi:hypothetical protein
MNDLDRIRVSDAEREFVVARLQHATTEGRLSLDEMGDRVSSAYASVTRLELDRLVDDLPPAAEPVAAEEPAPDQGSEITSGALAILVVALGVAAVPISFASPLGPVLGVAAVVLGVLALSARRDMPAAHRAATAAGMIVGLLPPVFFLTLLLILGS